MARRLTSSKADGRQPCAQISRELGELGEPGGDSRTARPITWAAPDAIRRRTSG